MCIISSLKRIFEDIFAVSRKMYQNNDTVRSKYLQINYFSVSFSLSFTTFHINFIFCKFKNFHLFRICFFFCSNYPKQLNALKFSQNSATFCCCYSSLFQTYENFHVYIFSLPQHFFTFSSFAFFAFDGISNADDVVVRTWWYLTVEKFCLCNFEFYWNRYIDDRKRDDDALDPFS